MNHQSYISLTCPSPAVFVLSSQSSSFCPLRYRSPPGMSDSLIPYMTASCDGVEARANDFLFCLRRKYRTAGMAAAIRTQMPTPTPRPMARPDLGLFPS